MAWKRQRTGNKKILKGSMSTDYYSSELKNKALQKAIIEDKQLIQISKEQSRVISYSPVRVVMENGEWKRQLHEGAQEIIGMLNKYKADRINELKELHDYS